MKKLLYNLSAFTILAAAILQILASTASASFTANDIIDDPVFDNVGTMNASQIDSFLNGFVSSCISPNSGFQARIPSGYSPSGGFTYGNFTSAGNVIAATAQAYGINPQVLLATLQKEQSLVVGGSNNFCNNSDENKYSAAVGYGCPDSGSTYSWTSVSLYMRSGVEHTSTGPTCVNSPSKAGFSQQVIRGAWLLKFGEQRSEGNVNWAIISGSWNNSDDPHTCYGGPITQGFRKRCSSDTSATYYDGLSTIDATSVHMDTGATAALYWYTPHFSGNQHFVNIFESWFGLTHNSYAANSTYSKSSCNIPDFDTDRVGRMYNPERKDFLFTTSHLESCLAIRSGYIWDGLVFQNYAPSTDTIAVYRLSSYARHLYTSSATVRQDYLTNKGYQDEGIAFYAKNTASGNIPVYCLVSNDTVTYTSASGENALLATEGYSNAGVAFYTGQLPNNLVSLYRLSRGAQRLYTTSDYEKDAAQLFYGYTWEYQHISQVSKNPAINLVPVYRLSAPGRYFYTTNRGERDIAVVFYGYSSEGTEFYAYPTQALGTVPEYRLTDSNGNRLFTPDASERQLALSRFGYQDEGTGWYTN
jgi:hypothetical protein